MAHQAYQAIPTQSEARKGSLAVPVLILFLGGVMSVVGPFALYESIRDRMAFDAGSSEVEAEVTDVMKWPRRSGDVYEVKYRFDAAPLGQPISAFHGRCTVSMTEQSRNNYRHGRRASVIYATHNPTISRLKSEGPPNAVWPGGITTGGLALLFFARACRRRSLREMSLAKELDEAGLVTQGRVKSFVRYGTRSTAYLLTYEFIEGWCVEQSVGRKIDLSEGQAVRVRYLERDPRISRAE